MPTRSRGTLSKRAIALPLACVLGASLLVTASPAKAENHMPWDQPGTTWQGTLTTSIDHTYSDAFGGRVTNHEEASYTELSSLESTADGSYDAHLVASGTQDDYGSCYGREGIHHLRTYDWQLDTQGPNPIAGYAHKFGLTTDDDGNTFFALWYQTHIPFHVIHYCTGDGDDPPIEETYPAYNGISKLGFFDGSNPGYSSNPLPDLDPDPLHLVGSKTWTLGDPPVAGMMDDGITEYTLTATYDLTLVTDECETHYTETDVRRARPKDTPDAPDLLEFSLATDWCVTESGRIRVLDTTSGGDTLLSAWEAGLAVGFEFLFDVKDVWTQPRVKVEDLGGNTTVTSTSKWRECFGIPIPVPTPKKLNKLADLFKKLARTTDNARVRDLAYKMTRILRKAANAFEDGLDWVGRQLWKGLLALVGTLPQWLSIRLANQLTFAAWDWADSGDWARDYVKDSLRDVTLSQILNAEYCTKPKWKPRIVTTLFPDGTALSNFINLDGDYGRWSVRRV